MDAEVAGRARSASSGLVPLVEGGCGFRQGHEAVRRLEEVGVVPVDALEVFAPEAESRVAREAAGTVAEPTGVGWVALVDVAVDYRARDLGVVRPRAAVEVVGADYQEQVVDDAHLCVDVDRCSVRVFEVVDRDAVASGAAQDVNDVLAADAAGGTGRAPAAVRIARHDRDDAQVTMAPQGIRERVRGLLRPQVLVFEVHEPSGAPKGFEIRRAQCCARRCCANGYGGRFAG